MPTTARLAARTRMLSSRCAAPGQVEEPLFDGIVELLDALEDDGWLLGVATGKGERGLRHCLANHGLEGRFVTLQTADRNPSKPHPAMALTAMSRPARTRRAPSSSAIPAGTWAAREALAPARSAPGWGYHELEELMDAGAHAVGQRCRPMLSDWPTNGSEGADDGRGSQKAVHHFCGH